MATYYVRVDGNDSNTGTGSGSGQAWQSIAKALGATGIGSGDTLYIAPGSYRQSSVVTIGGTYSVPTYIYGNPTASEFSGITPGRVLITTRQVSDTGAAVVGNQVLFSLTSKDYLNFENIIFECANAGNAFNITNCIELKWRKCWFQTCGVNSSISVTDNTVNGLTKNYLFQQCQFASMGSGNCYTDNTVGKGSATQNFVYGLTVDRCVSIANGAFSFGAGGATFGGTTFNFFNNTGMNIVFNSGAGRSLINIRNHISQPGGVIEVSQTGTADRFVTNSVAGSFSLAGNVVQTNNATNSYLPFNTGIWRLWGMTQYDWFSADGLYSYAAGSSTGTPATDFYGDAWAGGTPNIGSYNNTTATIAGQYNPTERNASTITIAPGSTSQSIELYLGATGLTASTAGLSAYFNRTRTADVQITPLVARSIGQAWTSGGFAEVNPNTMPGVYRLDIPNEALAAGADDVTVVVRGASGTNGAVMTIKLSSGGLTAAQTAAAVWDEPYTSHTAANTFGARVLKTTVDNRPAAVGTSQHIHANVHAIVDSTVAADELSGALLHNGTDYIDSNVNRISTSVAAADELEGALLHNGTDYIDSNLLSGNSTRVFVGRFQMTQTGTTQGDIIEAFTTDTPAFELQLFDGDNNLVPVTGATLGLRILDVTSTVVETGTPTIEYGTGGIVRWTAPGTYLSIGCPAGMYRMFVDRTVSGTTTTFGPLQIKVQVQ